MRLIYEDEIAIASEGGEKVTEFEEIYREYFKDVFLFIKGLSQDDNVAEEITSETFFKALKSLDSFKGNCDIRVWLCQIAKNTYYSYMRKNKRLESFEEQMTEMMGQAADATGGMSGTAGAVSATVGQMAKPVEDAVVDKETALAIHRILHDMEEPYKEVFSLRVFGELSFGQIGSIFGKTENWACVTFHRAKAKIQERMEE